MKNHHKLPSPQSRLGQPGKDPPDGMVFTLLLKPMNKFCFQQSNPLPNGFVLSKEHDACFCWEIIKLIGQIIRSKVNNGKPIYR